MEMARIVHPDVPGVHEVPVRSVGQWARSGWRPEGEPAEQPFDQGGVLPPAVVEIDTGAAVPVIAEDKPRRRRGAAKDGE